MKEVKAVIVPSKLETVHRALRSLPGFPGMSVAKVEGYTGDPDVAGATTSIRDELTDHRHRLLLLMVVDDAMADAVHDALVKVAASGVPGGAVVWITAVERSSFVRKTF